MLDSFRRHKIRAFFLALAGILIVARLIAPSIILHRLNAYLENFSPLYRLHIGQVHLHIYRMAYSFEVVTGDLKDPALKQDSAHFADIRNIDIALAWRELIRGRVVADVNIDQAKLKITKATLGALSGEGKTVKVDAKNVKDATVPFDLERVLAQNSQFEFSDVADLPPEQNFLLSGIEVVANNLTPRNEIGLALVSAVGDLQQTAKIKVIAQFRPKQNPVDWSVNLEMRKLELAKLNPIALRMGPVTFKSGELSVFSAMQSKGGNLHGYFKPFLTDLVFVGDHADFKNVPQFFIEILGTVGNFFLKNTATRTLAMKVNFTAPAKGKMDIDTGKALKTAIKNGYGRALKPALDETLELE